MSRKILGFMVAVVLVFSMVAGLGVPVSVSAKTTKHSVSLFVDEELPLSIAKGKIKKIKSSDKSVVKAKKEDQLRFRLFAKKAGAATVTVKTSKGKHIYNVKVENSNFSVTQDSLFVKNSFSGSQYTSTITFKVVNNTSVHIGSATVKYTLKDTKGAVVENGSFVVNTMVPGGAAYRTVDYPLKDTALASGEAEVTNWTRDPNYIFTDQSAKISVISDEKDKAVFVITNNSDVSAAGNADIMYRDADGAVIYMESASFYLPPGGNSTYTTVYVPNSYAKVDIAVRAASSIEKRI